jgi:hypothetical protein
MLIEPFNTGYDPVTLTAFPGDFQNKKLYDQLA